MMTLNGPVSPDIHPSAFSILNRYEPGTRDGTVKVEPVPVYEIGPPVKLFFAGAKRTTPFVTSAPHQINPG